MGPFPASVRGVGRHLGRRHPTTPFFRLPSRDAILSDPSGSDSSCTARGPSSVGSGLSLTVTVPGSRTSDPGFGAGAASGSRPVMLDARRGRTTRFLPPHVGPSLVGHSGAEDADGGRRVKKRPASREWQRFSVGSKLCHKSGKVLPMGPDPARERSEIPPCDTKFLGSSNDLEGSGIWPRLPRPWHMPCRLIERGL